MGRQRDPFEKAISKIPRPSKRARTTSGYRTEIALAALLFLALTGLHIFHFLRSAAAERLAPDRSQEIPNPKSR